jgi:hypothetical protein
MRPVTKYSQIMPSTTSFHNPPFAINPNLGLNQSPSLLEDTNHYYVAQSRDVYHGLPPIDFPRKESQSGFASRDIRNSEVTSDSLVPYQVMWLAQFTVLWNLRGVWHLARWSHWQPTPQARRLKSWSRGADRTSSCAISDRPLAPGSS